LNEIRPGNDIRDWRVDCRWAAGFPQSRDVTCDHNRAAREAFNDGESEPFIFARNEDDTRGTILLGEIRSRKILSMIDGIREPKPSDLVSLFCRPGTTDFDQLDFRISPSHFGNNLEQYIDPFARNATANVQEGRWTLETNFARREFGRDAEGGVNQFRRVDQTVAEQVRSGLSGDQEDSGGFLQSRQRPSGQGAKPPRSRIGGRVNKAAERIEVVAISPAAFRR